jgi:hypothetical protein
VLAVQIEADFIDSFLEDSLAPASSGCCLFSPVKTGVRLESMGYISLGNPGEWEMSYGSSPVAAKALSALLYFQS